MKKKKKFRLSKNKIVEGEIICPNCDSQDFLKRGKLREYQRYFCQDCGGTYYSTTVAKDGFRYRRRKKKKYSWDWVEDDIN